MSSTHYLQEELDRQDEVIYERDETIARLEDKLQSAMNLLSDILDADVELGRLTPQLADRIELQLQENAE